MPLAEINQVSEDVSHEGLQGGIFSCFPSRSLLVAGWE